MKAVESTGRRFLLTAFVVILAATIWGGRAVRVRAQTQPPSSPPAVTPNTNPGPTEKSVPERLATLERDTSSNKQRLDDTFNILLGLGGIATLGILLFTFLSLYRDHQQQQNYRREREFLEERDRQQMSNPFFDRPIVNSPYEYAYEKIRRLRRLQSFVEARSALHRRTTRREWSRVRS